MAGEGAVDYAIAALPLLPGRYLLSAAVYDDDLITAYDHRDRCTPLVVVEGGTAERIGVIELDAPGRRREPDDRARRTAGRSNAPRPASRTHRRAVRPVPALRARPPTSRGRWPGPRRPRVLDVGGSHSDFWGRAHRPMAKFLPESAASPSTSPEPAARLLRARARRRPAVPGSHLRPGVLGRRPGARPARARARVLARRCACPRARWWRRRSTARRSTRAEALVSDFVRAACGYVQGQLREHREHGWPDLAATADALEARAGRCACSPTAASGSGC